LHLIQWDSGGVVSDINLFIPPESGPLSGGGSSDENGILLTELIQNRVYLYDSLFQFKSRVDLPDLLAKDHQKKHLIYYSHKYGLLVYLTDTGKFHILREKENKLQVVQTLLSPKGGLYLEVVGEKLRIYSDHACISQVGLSLNVFSMIFTDCSDF
jgi:hypothetical protein